LLSGLVSSVCASANRWFWMYLATPPESSNNR
jgi:hypothetical protein